MSLVEWFSLKRDFRNLREQHLELQRRYRALCSLKMPPAPNDGPWQTRFAELDTEYNKLAESYHKAVYANGELELQVGALNKLLEKRACVVQRPYPFTICNATSPQECQRDVNGTCVKCGNTVKRAL